MSRRLVLNKYGKIEELTSDIKTKLDQLHKRKVDVLKMIRKESNNQTRGIYKTQLIHLDIEIQKLENAK